MFINDSELLSFLEEHVKEKMRYYSIYRFVMSNFKKPDDNMKQMIQQYNLNTKEKTIKFIVNELNRYQTNRYQISIKLFSRVG